MKIVIFKYDTPVGFGADLEEAFADASRWDSEIEDLEEFEGVALSDHWYWAAVTDRVALEVFDWQDAHWNAESKQFETYDELQEYLSAGNAQRGC